MSVLICCAGSGCSGGADNAGDEPADTDGGSNHRRVERLSLLFAGGECSDHDDCWKRHGIEADNTLVLSDAVGKERFALSPEEYASVEASAQSEEFDLALAQAETFECKIGFDNNVFIEVQWADGEVDAPQPSIGGCVRARGESDHVFSRLAWQLAELASSHLDCPPFEPPPAGWNPNTDPWYVRMLCYDPCGRQCG